MKDRIQAVLYWDSSAVLSALFKDTHSPEAIEWSQKPGIHLISSLVYAEVYAVLSRFKRERRLADILIDAAYEAFETGPWRKLNIHPDVKSMKALASQGWLRGADLWHLSAALTLKSQLPELLMLTFDQKLRSAAQAEGLLP